MGPEITQDPDRMDDVVDLKTLPTGTEAKVRLLKFNTGTDKNGADYYQPRLEVADDPYCKDFTYFLGLPSQYDDAKQMNQKKQKIKDFCLAFGVQPPPTITAVRELFDSGDLIGLEAWAVLVEKETDEYGMQNEVRKFIKPV